MTSEWGRNLPSTSVEERCKARIELSVYGFACIIQQQLIHMKKKLLLDDEVVEMLKSMKPEEFLKLDWFNDLQVSGK